MSEFLEAARDSARGAGELIRSHLGQPHTVERKGVFDFVTEVDRKSEAYIRARLSTQFPEHGFFCEEQISGGALDEDEQLNAVPDHVWIVDALDGTTNFIRGIPQFAVSVALAYRGELIAGAVYDPSRDELFSAEKGGGATLNGRPIHVSNVDTLGAAIVSAGFPAADMEKRAQTVERLNMLAPKLGSLRMYNCAALLLCYVAAGRTDASFELGLHLWDMAAGVLLVREAGGNVTRADGSPFDLHARDNLAGNETLRRLIVT